MSTSSEDVRFEKIVSKALEAARQARHNEATFYSSGAKWRYFDYVIKWPTALVAGLSGLSLFANNPRVTGVLSVLTVFLASLNAAFVPGENATIHRSAAASYALAAERLEVFADFSAPRARDLWERATDQEQRYEIYDQLVTELQGLRTELARYEASRPELLVKAIQRTRKRVASKNSLKQAEQAR